MLVSYFLKGLIIGFLIACPVGPINVLCVRRTILHGRLAGIVSGLGAAVADLIFGALAVFGLFFVTGFLMEERFWLALGGAALLAFLGIRALLKPAPKLVSGRDPTNLIGDFTSTFFLTLANPITILSFLGIFAAFGVDASHEIAAYDWLLLSGVFLGSMAWWLLITSLIGIFHGRFTETGLKWANRGAGILMLAFAAIVLIEVVRLWTGASRPPW